MKIGMAIAASLVAFCAFTGAAWAKLGDVDCSADLPNSEDALLLLQVSAGYLTVEDLACPGNADVDGDGRVDAVDALRVFQMQFDVPIGPSEPRLIPPVSATPYLE